jgi:hypothetical protein
VNVGRFAYSANRSAERTYSQYRRAFWPPADRYTLTSMALEPSVPPLGEDFRSRLASLRDTVDQEWRRNKAGDAADGEFSDSQGIADLLRALAECLPKDTDRDALRRRASIVADGPTLELLAALVDVNEDITIVCGHILTWYGKHAGRLPTAFGCRTDAERRGLVLTALARTDDVSSYLRSLHADLLLGDIPEFAPTQLFFMAGEGNLHPKHIAYFLPNDEGITDSPFRKTYYFANSHTKMLAVESAYLAGRFLDLGRAFDPADSALKVVPVLGVVSHELGHTVMRPATSYADLHVLDRWSSAVLQEVAADVFGILILAEVWARRFAIEPADAVTYHFAECLRYINRGLGHYPDSDGMYLQLAYLVSLGALSIEHGSRPMICGEPVNVLSGLRSLARVLADALLAGEAGPAVALYRMYGPPAGDALQPLLEALSALPSTSVEYVQDHLDRSFAG